jgi:hypothetical protein
MLKYVSGYTMLIVKFVLFCSSFRVYASQLLTSAIFKNDIIIIIIIHILIILIYELCRAAFTLTSTIIDLGGFIWFKLYFQTQIAFIFSECFNLLASFNP